MKKICLLIVSQNIIFIHVIYIIFIHIHIYNISLIILHLIHFMHVFYYFFVLFFQKYMHDIYICITSLLIEFYIIMCFYYLLLLMIFVFVSEYIASYYPTTSLYNFYLYV